MAQRSDRQLGLEEQPEDRPVTGGSLSRRQLLAGGTVAGLGVLAGVGIAGYAWGRSSTNGTSGAPGTAGNAEGAPLYSTNGAHSFVSRPDLQPPMLDVDLDGTPSGIPEYVFLATKPYKGGSQVGQDGVLIASRAGEITWFSPIASGQVLNFDVQSYKGQNVLTWWHGMTGAEYGKGTCYIYDSSYTKIATVQCGNGLQADMHEFVITPQGTALIDAYQPRANVDLRAVGGTRNGVALTGVV